MAEITRRRCGELLKKLFEILLASPDGLPAATALDKLSNSVTLTEYESGLYESTGTRRFEKIVRFATVDCVKAGWLLKMKGVWSVTEVGRGANTKYADPEAFYREAVRLYRAWKIGQGEKVASVADPLESENVEESVSVTFEQAEEQAWGQIEQHLRNMNPFEFQELVAGLLRAMGYHVSWVAPPGKDGGVDIIAHVDPLGTKAPRIKIQVKRRSDKISSDELKSFMANISDGDVGLYISTGGFTRDAEDYARNQERRRITLINLPQLVDLWKDHYSELEEAARRRLPLTPIYFLMPED
jgi:restriction system protein